MVRPVPPEVVGRAVPERVRFKLALLVGFVTVAFKNAGVVADTEVTVPVFASVSLTYAVPLYFNTCPLDGVVIVTSLNCVKL